MPIRSAKKEDRVRLKIIYNGYTHDAIGFLFETKPHVIIQIWSDQLPKGYLSEHGADIDFSPMHPEPLVPDESGEHGWVCIEPLDIDAFASRTPGTE